MTNLINNLSRPVVSPTLCVGLLTLLLSWAPESAHAFGKKPVTAPKPPAQTQPTDPTDIIRARWEGQARDGVEWSKHVFNRIPAMAPNLLKKVPADIAQFCPNYASLNETDKKNFWVYLISSMAELESSFKPETAYTEAFYDQQGKRVVSRGLLQISQESANGYGCGITNANMLHDPATNLDCGLRILNKWVYNDGRLAGKSGSTWLGGARYWSVLRNATPLGKIQSWNQAQRICAR